MPHGSNENFEQIILIFHFAIVNSFLGTLTYAMD